jgi:uncharacterized protein YndB with AHSA1/START domain
MTQVNQTTKELIITRIFDAPRERVWKAWTEPEQIMRWWGPKDFTSPVSKIDLREGGKYLFCMRSPDGQDFYSTGVFQKIDPPNELVYTDSFADAQGNVVPASQYGLGADFPLELQVTVTFEDWDGKTKMTLKQAGLPAGELSDQTQAGWNESFDKLAVSLGGKNHLVVERANLAVTMSRVFDAPRERVWRVITDPDLVPQWWGPREYTTIVDKMDFKVGGVWRYIHKGAGGDEYAFNGVYKEITPPERLVYTFEFEPVAGHISTDTITFEELPGGKTKLTARTTFDNLEDLEGMVQSGMESGAVESWDRLEELLQPKARHDSI